MAQYVWAYTGQLYNWLSNLGIDPTQYGVPQGGNHQAARAFADSDRAAQLWPILQARGVDPAYATFFRGAARPAPGTEAFRQILNAVTSQPNTLPGGARFVDRSSLYHPEAQYDLSDHFRVVNLLVGGNLRYILTNSQGTIL